MDEVDELECRKLVAVLKVVEVRARENERFFSGRNKADLVDQAFRETFADIYAQIADGIIPAVKDLYKVAGRYDPGVDVRANGIRSWLGVVGRLATELNSLASLIESTRRSVFFRRVRTATRLRSVGDYLASTRQCLDVIRTYTQLSSKSVVLDIHLPDADLAVDGVLNVMSTMRTINVGAFRGRTQCFHFDPTVSHISHGVLLTFAAYCQAYKHGLQQEEEEEEEEQQDDEGFDDLSSAEKTPSTTTSTSTRSSWSSSSSSLSSLWFRSSSSSSTTRSPPSPTRKDSPWSRARLVSLLTSADALSEDVRLGLANLDLRNGLQSFWNLLENPLVLAGIEFLLPSIALSCVINLYSVPLTINGINGSGSTLDPPTAATGPRPTKCRLISNVLRLGQEYWLSSSRSSTTRTSSSSSSTTTPAAEAIVFQVHGGGFICQSSRSGEMFLRQFCNETRVPFFCVDYSLLPDDPFPRAVEEVVFAYCWMLNNFSKLGSTGRTIVALGDSAGGCLLLSLCIRLQQLGVRCPDSLLLCYPYVCATFAPSPSRLLSFADPLVPIPLLLRCCFGYAALDENDVRACLGIAESGTMDQEASPSVVVESTSHLRQCKTAPAQLFNQQAVIEQASRTRTTRRRRTLMDFSMRPFSPSERADVASLLALPLFGDPVFSPLVAPDDVLAKLPYVCIVTTSADPLLDDGVEMCRRIRRAGGKCTVTLVEGALPHGFLHMLIVSAACRQASDMVIKKLVQLVNTTTTTE